MALIDDGSVIFIVFQCREHGLDRRRRLAHKIVELAFRHHDIIRCQTNLTGIQRFACHHPRRGFLHVRRFGHDDRRFAAQFQRYRHKVFSRRTHHMRCNGRRASKQKMVERHFREISTGFGATENDGDIFNIKIFLAQFFRQKRAMRGIFRRLDDGAIASGKNAAHRPKAQIKREIPRHDIANAAQRLIFDARAGTQKPQREHCVALGCFHPFTHVFLGIFQCCQCHADITCQRPFRAPVAKIGVQRIYNRVFIVYKNCNATVEQVNAALRRHRPFGNMSFLLKLNKATDFCFRRLRQVNHLFCCTHSFLLRLLSLNQNLEPLPSASLSPHQMGDFGLLFLPKPANL